MSVRLFLLDTNVVLALVRAGPLGFAIDRRFKLRAAKQRPLVSVVTHGEIRVLARRNGWGDRKMAALDDALRNLVCVDINHPKVIEAYVDIDLYSCACSAGARNMGKNDLWIAACVKAAGATLITTDRDFDHLSPDLLDVAWVDPRAVAGYGKGRHG